MVFGEVGHSPSVVLDPKHLYVHVCSCCFYHLHVVRYSVMSWVLSCSLFLTKIQHCSRF